MVDWGLAKDLAAPRVDDTPDNGAAYATIAAGSARRGFGPSGMTATREGAVIGTPAYMSPEQARGDVRELTPATDIFSLGAILYEILTGQSPFRSGDIETTLAAVRAGRFVPVRAVRPAVPKPLAAICHKALAADPGDRYADARAIVADLRRFLAGEAVSVHRDGWVTRAARWCRPRCRRRPAVASGFGATAAVTLVGSVLFAIASHGWRHAEAEARREAEAAHREAVAAHREMATAHRDAVDRLADARDAGEPWLLGMSGPLKYPPSLECLREDLLERAAAHYGRSAATSAAAGRDDPWSRLERARCEIRSGDMERLLGDTASARGRYEAAGRVLATIDVATRHLDPQEIALARINAKIGFVLTGGPDDTETARRELLAAIEDADPGRAARAKHTFARLAVARSRTTQDVAPGSTAGDAATAEPSTIVLLPPRDG